MIKLKDIINEVSVTAGAEAFQGGAGDIVDRKFAGPFHPEFGKLKKMLHQQIDGDIEKRMYSDDHTPPAEKDFVDMEYEYGFDKPKITDDSKFINKSVTNWKNIDKDIEYDDYNSKYNPDDLINQSKKDWEYVGKDIKYDNNYKSKYDQNYMINQSKKNWEYINKDYHTKMSDKNMRVDNVNIKYNDDIEDRDSTIYAGDNFINKSMTNWKYIN